MPCVYILFSKSKSKIYVGSSREAQAQNRFIAHNNGKTRSTKSGRPWHLVYEEEFQNYTEARQRENFLKSGQGRKWIRDRFK